MTRQRVLHATWTLCVPVMLSAIACGRTPARDAEAISPLPSPETAKGAVRTVFTDTALFRQNCTEADSGLSARAGRCTPRDQSVKYRKS